MSKVALPYLPIPPGMDKVQFGHKFFCLPYLPIQLVWTFWNQSLLLEKVSKTSRQGGSLIFMGVQGLFSIFRGGVFTIYKSLRGVRDHFKNFQGRFWNFAYFYKYGHQYLTYLPQFFLSKLFFRKKVWLGNTLPTYGLDICPNFCSFFFGGLSLAKVA